MCKPSKSYLPLLFMHPCPEEQEQITFNCRWVTGFWEKPIPHLLLQKRGISAMNRVPTPTS